MRQKVIDYVGLACRLFEAPAPVFDFGGLLAVEQEAEFGHVLRHMFAGLDYKTFDPRPGADIQGDMHRTGLPDGAVGTALCMETLEHIPHPAVAMFEMFRVLRSGGLLVVTTLMCWEEHRCPNDYWRFMPDGLRLLLEHPGFEVLDLACETTPTAPGGIFIAGRKP